MKGKIKAILAVFIIITMICAIGRTGFYLVHHSLIASGGEASFLPMLLHGLRLDVAVAGYLCILPCLLAAVSAWLKGKNSIRTLGYIWKVYFSIAALILALAILLNIVLYGYWGFPLDSTPLFYFLTSPKDAAASTEWWMIPCGIIGLAITTTLFAYPLFRTYGFISKTSADSILKKAATSVLCLLMGGLMIVPIRGGFTVAVNNVGSVYFSDNVRLNHAAVNPVFSFLDSMSHEEDFASMYRFMDDEEASRLFNEMKHTGMRPDSISDYRIANDKGTRVVIVILESFSSYIMTEEGHVKGVTPTLDQLSKEGIYFNHFYANSFRTDRGLVSILSGFPAQPNMSLMKYPRKTNDLYSIARSLKNDGFSTQYVYGGDANFTNMRSYLMATGFQHIISEDDFPAEQLTGKWGVNDGHLFEKALARMDETWSNDSKNLMVIQTSSSHEPYDVPCHKFNDKILNAFYYTDHELGSFVEKMKQRTDWKNTLLVLVPDHLGCWPDPEDNYKMRRYHIPLILTGGALKEKATLSTYGSQQDIAATLLGMLGIDHSEFTYSKDMFDNSFHHFAFFTHPDAVGMADEYNQTMVDNPSRKPLFDLGTKRGANQRKAQAYLQKLFDDIAIMK